MKCPGEKRRESTALYGAQSSPQDTAQAPTPQTQLRAGEKAFTVGLFLAGVFFFWQALRLWLRMPPPRIASAAALPLLASGLWAALALLRVIESLRKEAPPQKGEPFPQKLRAGMRYAFPRETFVMICAIVAYCALLLCGAGFYVVTPVFLYGSMCYLSRGGYVKNLLWTAIVMAFIVGVFQLLFGMTFS